MTDEAHPLFPPKNEDDDAPEVEKIKVLRLEGNTKATCPRNFDASELTEESQIFELFGGGTYELVAYAGGRITRKVALTLPGRSKPLVADAPPSPSPGAAEGLPMMAATPSAGMPAWLPALLPVLMTYLQGQQQMQQLQMKAQSDLLAVMMTNSQNGAREYVQSMQSLHNANLQQLTAVLSRGSGGGGTGDFMQGIQFMQEFLEGQREQMQNEGGGDEGSVMKTVEQALEAMKLYQEMKKAGAPAPSEGA